MGRPFGWTVTVLGFACWAIAVVTKLLLEKSMGRELDGCVRQLEKVKKQLRSLAEERDALDQRLPAGGGPLDARVAAAEQYVKRLEELTPLETRHQAALQKSEGGKERIQRAAEELREAEQQWRVALRSVNLPESFRPEHIQQLSEGNDQTVQLGRRLQIRREEFAEREMDLATVTERVETLLKEVQITAASSDPRTQLRQLAAAMAEQRQWMARRKELRQEHRELKRSFREAAEMLRKLLRQRRALLRQARVNDDQALRKLADRQSRIEVLTRRRDELNQRIKLSIGTQCTEAAVADALKPTAEIAWNPTGNGCSPACRTPRLG
jgi:DNA repair exonuclease SbcCD ATPase subunit